MTGSSVAGIITAATLLVTAIGGAFTAYGVLKNQRRNDRLTTEVGKKVDTVHEIVNQRYTDIDNFNRALVRALRDAGIPVPVDQSKPAEGES